MGKRNLLQRRREYDTSDAHDLASYAHERLDKMEPKMDTAHTKLNMILGAIVLLSFLLGGKFVDFSSLTKITEAKAAQTETKK